VLLASPIRCRGIFSSLPCVPRAEISLCAFGSSQLSVWEPYPAPDPEQRGTMIAGSCVCLPAGAVGRPAAHRVPSALSQELRSPRALQTSSLGSSCSPTQTCKLISIPARPFPELAGLSWLRGEMESSDCNFSLNLVPCPLLRAGGKSRCLDAFPAGLVGGCWIPACGESISCAGNLPFPLPARPPGRQTMVW